MNENEKNLESCLRINEGNKEKKRGYSTVFAQRHINPLALFL
jgi:hypothetical protein